MSSRGARGMQRPGGNIIAPPVSITIEWPALAGLAAGVKSHAFLLGPRLPVGARMLNATIGEGNFADFDDPSHALWRVKIGEGSGPTSICSGLAVSTGFVGFPKTPLSTGTVGARGVPALPISGQPIVTIDTAAAAVDLNAITVGRVVIVLLYLVTDDA